MTESEKDFPNKENPVFKVVYPDREKDERPLDYYKRTVKSNLKELLKRNNIITNHQLNKDVDEFSSAFGTELGKKSEAALTDPLTGLLNRRGFKENTENLMAESFRLGFSLTFIYGDIDDFKTFNDEYGHQAGDNFLKLLAGLLITNLRKGDISARIGGDEFGFVMIGASSKKARKVVRRLNREIKFLIHEQYQSLSETLGFSFGIEEWDGKKTVSEIMDQADKKLYRKKKQKNG